MAAKRGRWQRGRLSDAGGGDPPPDFRDFHRYGKTKMGSLITSGALRGCGRPRGEKPEPRKELVIAHSE